MKAEDIKNLHKAYIVGISLGDGNLSNPNGRATRLRITCDSKYPKLIEEIKNSLRIVFPKNKVSEIKRKNCIDISVYSNSLEELLGWKCGSEHAQSATIPHKILYDKILLTSCVKGLIQTDGSIYTDRGYEMINFTNKTKILAYDVYNSIIKLGFSPQVREVVFDGNTKYIVRLSKDVQRFKNEIGFWKE